MLVMKGIDGIYTDYPAGVQGAFSLIGSNSLLFQTPLPDSDPTVETGGAS
jgi:hypothetical protein